MIFIAITVIASVVAMVYTTRKDLADARAAGREVLSLREALRRL